MRTTVVLMAVLGCAPALAAQDVGKIQGHVRTDGGAPLAGAQVFIAGTRAGNITNADGFYFINNVPAGVHDLQAQLIGYQAVVLREQRILAGQTATQNFSLTIAPVEVTALVVVGEITPLVPRDQLASKSIVTGDAVDDLPVDNLNQLLVLQPGVVAGGRKGLSIRGGRSGEEAVYIDGVLARNFNEGRSLLVVGTNTLSEVDVITGGFSAEFGEAQSGIINYVTRSSARRWTGTFTFQSDDIAPKQWSTGFNRAELAFSGPVVKRIGFFFGGTATGQRFANGSRHWRSVPIYVQQGIDTVIACSVPACLGDATSGGAGTREVVIPGYKLYDNGGRYPFSGGDEYTIDTKVDYSYGEGSRVFVTQKLSRNQTFVPPRTQIYNLSNRSATLAKSRATILSWTHNIVRSTDRALSLDLKLARFNDWSNKNNLSVDFNPSHTQPWLGFSFRDYDLLRDRERLHVDQKLVDDFLRNRIENVIPFPDRVDLRRVTEFRMNPYAVNNNFSTKGVDGGDGSGLDFAEESSWQARVTLDWQINRFHRAKFGGDYFDIDVARFATFYGSLNAAQLWVENPRRASVFVQDRVDIGDLVLELGLRYDRFDPNSNFPTKPGYYVLEDSTTFAPAEIRQVLSPRLGVAFPVTASSTVRLGYGHFTQLPDLNEYYRGKNTNYFEFRNTSQGQILGRALDLPKTIAFEFGYRQILSADFVLDFAVFNRQKLRDISARKEMVDNPVNPGDTTLITTFTNADFGIIKGFDVRVDRRYKFVNGTIGYSYQDARNTGTDPFSALALAARLEGNAQALLGGRPNPSEQVRITEENRKHNFTGSLSFNVPASHSCTVCRGFGLFATARVISGFPYTPTTTTGELKEGELLIEKNPWQRYIDMRVVKALPLRTGAVRFVLDARNLFDFENELRVEPSTGTVRRDWWYDQQVEAHRATLAGGAPKDVIDLSTLERAGPGVTNDVDLFLLRRAEQRFGDGNGLFTAGEQERAFRAAEEFLSGPQDMIGPGRRVRLGFEITF